MKFSSKALTYLVLLIINISCWEQLKPDKISDEFYGRYIFQYPSSEAEVLTIYSNGTFRQQIYKDELNLREGSTPFLTNTGKWSQAPDNTLQFQSWLNYCYMFQTDSILLNPDKSLLPNVIWVNSKNSGKEKIFIYHETGFVFDKDIIDEPN